MSFQLVLFFSFGGSFDPFVVVTCSFLFFQSLSLIINRTIIIILVSDAVGVVITKERFCFFKWRSWQRNLQIQSSLLERYAFSLVLFPTFLILLGALLFLDIREAIWYLNWLYWIGFPLSSCFCASHKLESHLFFLLPWGSRCSAPFSFRNRVVTSTRKKLIGREIIYKRIFRISLTSMLVFVQARRCKYGLSWVIR